MSIGASNQFGNAFRSVLLVALLTVGTAFVAAIRMQIAGKKTGPTIAKILTFGWAAVVVAATATPTSFSVGAGGGDLVLAPGRGGLSDWKVLFDARTSLAGVLFVLNVVLYVPLGFGAAVLRIGSPTRVLAGCLVLSVLVETIQFLFLGRVASTDDVLLNVVGAAFGVAIGWFLLRARQENGALETQPPV